MIRDTNYNASHDHDGGDDIVKINIGGKIFTQVLRSTLCQAPNDALFTRLFCKNPITTLTGHLTPVTIHYDDKGRIFLDHDPELIEIIINFMRSKQIEDPFDPIVKPPEVPSHKSKDFRRLLNYFGLTAFFFYQTPLTTARIARAVRSMSIEEEPHLYPSIVHDLVDDSASIDDTNKSVESIGMNSVDSTSNGIFGHDYCYG